MNAAAEVTYWQADFSVPLGDFSLEAQYTSNKRVTGIFGPSGSGKTTWLETMAGLRPGARGRLAFGSEEWLNTASSLHVPAEKRNIGYVPQEHLLMPHLSVKQNIGMGQKRALQNGKDFSAVFASTVDVLDLVPLLERPVNALSGGEKQRVALARALCSGPRLLLLDEPLAALDGSLRRRILPYLLKVRDQFAIPMLLVSHNPVEVQALCDELVILRQGRIVAVGEPRQVLSQSSSMGAASREGFQNVLPATIHSVSKHTAKVDLQPANQSSGAEQGTVQLVVPRTDSAAGGPVLVGVAADEILVSTKKPEGLSARNCLMAEITHIDTWKNLMLLKARIGHALPELVVELTEDAVAELDLSPGKTVFLLIKTSSITLYE